jgi:hypothetical protein
MLHRFPNEFAALAVCGLTMACSGSDKPSGEAAIAAGPNMTVDAAGSAGAPSSSGAVSSAGGLAGATSGGAPGLGGAPGGSAGATQGLGGGAAAGSGGNSGASSSAGSAGTAGGSGGAAQAGCGAKPYQLCDDFEGDSPGQTGSVWKIRKGFPSEIVTDVVHSGAHAVRVTANNTGSGAIEESTILPAGKDYWLRVYMYLDSDDNGGHEGFVVAHGKEDNYRLYNNTGKGNVMIDRTSNEFGFVISKAKLPRKQWNCWEWHETATEIHTYLDGQEIDDALAKWPGITVTSFSFGFERYHPGGLGYVYYDDIVLDTERVGCN